ncbi:hypothetical protein QVM48_17570, partial [Pseudomonas soli]|uniref:hypothetical protein n=1 Tax=Pseudomonas soli TaxID=1306993 RepID=UPI0035238CC8
FIIEKLGDWCPGILPNQEVFFRISLAASVKNADRAPAALDLGLRPLTSTARHRCRYSIDERCIWFAMPFSDGSCRSSLSI